VALEELDVTITTTEAPRTASIERVWLDDIRPRAGRTVSLKVLTRSYRGEEKITTVPIDIPANAASEMSILVTDGRQLNAIEQRELRRSLQPQSVAQMLRVLNDTRRNNRIYVRLLTGTPGAVVNGEAMTALPPSVLAVLESDRNGGSFTPIRSATLGEWQIPMESAVTGSRVLTIAIDKGARSPPSCATFSECGGRPRSGLPSCVPPLRARRFSQPLQPSGRFPRSPIFSKATSRTCRSTATVVCFLDHRPRSWLRPRRRFCGRSWLARTARCGLAAATRERC
jgi:hypothetical protein